MSARRRSAPSLEHPRNIVLVRHGETPANAAGKKRTGRFFNSAKVIAELGGKADHELPLTAEGRDQARRIGRLLRDKWLLKRFNVYYDSGYQRSIETLDLILEEFPKSERIEKKRRSHLDLRERDAGYAWSIPLRRARRLFPWWEKYEKLVGPIYSRPPGGESIADAWLRVHMFLNSVRRARPDKDLLVVTHGRIMIGFKYWMEKRPAREANELYEQYKGIANCEAWWYKHDSRKRRYVLVDCLRP